MAERITEIELAELEQIVENSGGWYSPVMANALYEYGRRLIAEVRALRDATSEAILMEQRAGEPPSNPQKETREPEQDRSLSSSGASPTPPSDNQSKISLEQRAGHTRSREPDRGVTSDLPRVSPGTRLPDAQDASPTPPSSGSSDGGEPPTSVEQRAGSEGQYRINPEVVSHAADSAGAPEPSPTPPTDDGTPGEGDSTVLNAEAVSARDAADTPLSPGVPDPQLLAAQTTYGSRLQRAKNAGIDQALSTTTGDETLDELRAKYAALGAAIKERRSA